MAGRWHVRDMSSEERAVWTAAFGATYAQRATARMAELGRGHSDVLDPDDADVCRQVADSAVRAFRQSGRAT